MKLSDKEIHWHQEGYFCNSENFEENIPLTNGDHIFREKDIKQAIKELWNELDEYTNVELRIIFNKIFGEELSK